MSHVSPTIRAYPTAEALSRAAAALFVSLGQRALAARQRFTVALAGGSTPRRLYAQLTEDIWRKQLDWSAVEIFFGDERAVAPDHVDSNFRMANDVMLSPLGVPARRIHRMPAERADLAAAAADYQTELARVFGLDVDDAAPVFDLVLLGLGSDGHTASLFPHTKALSADDAWVAANDVPQLDTRRMTLTLPVLNRAAMVMFLVIGANKADVLAEVLEGPPDPARLPAQSVRPASGEVCWFVDEAAAAKLSLPVIRGESTTAR
ncbi:MAG: 6-phosphogluconolactonase [Gammaproteobacteria bacterium]|nr:6-phosphogluconolactonase [Gammaproteobacteria bacterium]